MVYQGHTVGYVFRTNLSNDNENDDYLLELLSKMKIHTNWQKSHQAVRTLKLMERPEVIKKFVFDDMLSEEMLKLVGNGQEIKGISHLLVDNKISKVESLSTINVVVAIEQKNKKVSVSKLGHYIESTFGEDSFVDFPIFR